MGRRASRTVVPPVVVVTVLFLLALVPTATAGGGTFATAEAVNNNDLPVTKSGSLSTSETWYKVEAENFESIHNHNVYACIEKG